VQPTKDATMLQTQNHQEAIRTTIAAVPDLKRRRIRELNDAFRRSGTSTDLPSGRKMMSTGVRALSPAQVVAIALKVITFNAFTEDNDPNGEHDFGSFEHDGHKFFWKIDCYGLDMEQASPDPSDPAVTCRVLTVMLASEY
jgi:hypothetical protein